MVKFLTGLVLFVALSGCYQSPVRHIAKSPEVVVTEAGQVKLSGDAQVAPVVNAKKSGSRLDIPQGSMFEFDDSTGKITLLLSKSTSLTTSRSDTAITGPVSHTPDKGPTIGEEKKAESDFWTSIGLKAGMVVGAAIAIFGLVRAWDLVMMGGAAISAACAFGIFMERHPALLLIIGIGVAAAIIGPVLWHTKIKKLTAANEPNNR